MKPVLQLKIGFVANIFTFAFSKPQPGFGFVAKVEKVQDCNRHTDNSKGQNTIHHSTYNTQ